MVASVFLVARNLEGVSTSGLVAGPSEGTYRVRGHFLCCGLILTVLFSSTFLNRYGGSGLTVRASLDSLLDGLRLFRTSTLRDNSFVVR